MGMRKPAAVVEATLLSVTLAGCFFLIDALGPTGVAPFIYFQF